MEFVSTGFGLLFGFVLGILFARLFWKQTDSVPLDAHSQLLKQEASASERVRSLEGEKSHLQTSLQQAQQELLELHRKVSSLETKLPQLEQSFHDVQAEKERVRKQLELQQATTSNLTSQVATLDSQKKLLEQQLKAQQENFIVMLGQSKTEFENLANQILDTKSKKLSEQTTLNLDAVLKPLKEKLSTFEKKVEDSYTTEAKERFALKAEVERLIGLNEKMTQETQALTQALKGDSKIQGDWGELVLEKILEASGLREGHEYSRQKTYTSQEGDLLRPDIVINLPENKHIIVDSKVSLKAYELYCRSEEAPSRSQTLDAHLKSLHKHLDDLEGKHYSKLKGVNSPEFVFLFVPIEPAYLLAMQSDPDLSTRAWKKGIAIVTATSLLTSLKTVASIWRLENQNKNALEIATEGAKLYDKFVGFLDDFEKIGKTFESGQSQFTSAMGKLKEGPGNIFRKMELLRELGAAPNKRIKTELLE